MPMHNTVKVALIGGAFALAGAIVGNIAPIMKAGQREVPTTSGVGQLTLKLDDLPKPSPEMLKFLLVLDRKDLERVIDFPTVTVDGVGMTFTCLTETSQTDLNDLEKLAALGLGKVVGPEANATTPVDFPVLIQATGTDDTGAAFAVLEEEMALQYCSAATICPNRFAFEPSDAGIALRNYLRDLLAAQVVKVDS